MINRSEVDDSSTIKVNTTGQELAGMEAVSFYDSYYPRLSTSRCQRSRGGNERVVRAGATRGGLGWGWGPIDGHDRAKVEHRGESLEEPHVETRRQVGWSLLT